jgi:hypothetical protein
MKMFDEWRRTHRKLNVAPEVQPANVGWPVFCGNHCHTDDGNTHDQDSHREETNEDDFHLQGDPPIPE